MAKLPKGYSQDATAELLRDHSCEIPFHVVRMRFLGNIATPGSALKPIEMVQSLWNGALPAVDSIDTLNRILEMLVMGLWNDLTRHQKRSAPVRLTRLDASASRESLISLTRVRMEELDAFYDGLFGADEDLDLPQRADEAVVALGELRALFAGAHDLAQNDTIHASLDDIAKTVANFMRLTPIAERETHEAVMACARARRAGLRG